MLSIYYLIKLIYSEICQGTTYLKSFFYRKKVNLLLILPYAVGDTLMTYPTLLALKKSNVSFTCIGQPWSVKLFSNLNIEILSKYSLHRHHNFLWLYYICIKYKFNYCILFEKSLSALAVTKIIGIKTIGYDIFQHHFYKHFKSIRISPDIMLKYDWCIKHRVIQYYILNKRFIDDNIKLDKINSIIPLKNIYIKQTNLLIKKYNINKHFIIICPYASMPHKCWPYWKDFCKKFQKYQIIAVIAPSDYKRCMKEFPNIIIISSNLLLAGHIMKRAKYVLANDSGAMHLASFFGANIIGLASGWAGSSPIFAPWRGQFIKIREGAVPFTDTIFMNRKPLFARICGGADGFLVPAKVQPDNVKDAFDYEGKCRACIAVDCDGRLSWIQLNPFIQYFDLIDRLNVQR